MSPRRNYNDGQEIIYQDLDAETSVLELELYDRVIHELLQRVDSGFFSTSFQTTFVSSTSVSVANGLGMQLDNTQVDPEPLHRLIYQATSSTQNIVAPDTVHDRIDLICVKSARVASATDSRNYKDPVSLAISTQSFTVETDWSSTISVVTGTPGISPAVPSLPSGYLLLAQVYVHAVSGIASQSDITDERSLLPIAGNSIINTIGFNRAPVSTTEALAAILSSFDGYLTNGYQHYTDYDNLNADPSQPGTGKDRFYIKNGLAYLRNSAGTVTPIGSGGGGGGGANWVAAPGTAPLQANENGELVWLFDAVDAGAQFLNLFVKVPASYISGRPINLYIGEYSPSASGTILLSSIAYLIRQNLDAVTSIANSQVSGNSALTNSVASQYRLVELPLTNSTGMINGFNASPGDLILVVLQRGTDTDTNSIRFIPSATEITFI